MTKQHDFDGINRVMRAGRLVAGGAVPFRSMHLSPEGAGGDSAIATLDASDLIQVDPELKASAVKGKAELGQFVARVQSYAQAATRTMGEQHEKIVKLAADLKTAKETTEEALKAAQRAEAIAKDAARLAPTGAPALSIEALKTIPAAFEPDEMFVGKMGRSQYNVLMLSKAQLGLLDEPVAKFVERFRAVHDTIAMIDTYMLALGGRKAQNYLEAGGMEGLKLWKQYEPMKNQLKAAMDTAEAGAGLEWDPTGVGISLIEDVRPELSLASHIQSIPMPRSPYLWPVQGNHFKTYKLTEGTTDVPSTDTAGKIGKRNLSTLNLTFTAIGQGAMVLVSDWLVEDSIVPILAAIRADLAFAVNAGKEDGILDGQLTATIDSADVIAADDPRKFWDGLRYFGTLTGASYDFSTGLVVEGLTNLLGQMGKYGLPRFGVWATGYIGWAKMLTLKDGTGALVLTADRVGTTQALQSGTLGNLLGSPIAVCDDYPQAMGAAGVNDGSATDRTGLLRFDTRCFRDGEVRLSLIEASRDWAFETGQIAFRVTYRSSFKPVRTPSASYKCVGVGVGIPIA